MDLAGVLSRDHGAQLVDLDGDSLRMTIDRDGVRSLLVRRRWIMAERHRATVQRNAVRVQDTFSRLENSRRRVSETRAFVHRVRSERPFLIGSPA